jgi:cytosine deaminase
MLGIDGIARIAAGFPADLVIFPARDYSELIARHGGGRHVLRQGRMASAAIPDYEELDALLRPRGGDDI